ncbi:MAG: SH3 domain-containing protein [Desulfurivibrionaceae bacterium]|nr:SH3 domain-containing protein [Desulfobulbales bacterium]MDT8334824.1 SH3 domain-containing protein [Desulfurivibrionaceae bacterium]
MRLFLGTILFILMGAGNIHAEMVAVAKNLADIRSSPSEVVSTILFQVPRYYPLSSMESRDNFLKVTDYLGNSGWIRKDSVDDTRTVVVNIAGRANVRSGPGDGNRIVFKAHDGVCFKVLAEKDDWLQVEHETGVTGWIFKGLVWGN